MTGGQQAAAAAEQLDFRVLGPLEVRANSSTLTVKGRAERALLALLLTSPGRVFSVASIISGLWGAGAPPTADRTVQQYVSRLRRSLPADVVVTRAPGYLLDARPEQVDAERFRALVRQGRLQLSAGDCVTAAATFGDALLMWRGEPFGEFEQAAFAAAERTALDELRLAAVEDRVQAELAVGVGAELVGELETLLSHYPLRERLWGQLMTALYRSGRQADALAAYQRARSLLIDELGIEPGPDLRTIEARVLAHDDALLAPTSSFERALPPPLAAVGPTFIGRENELQMLVDSLDQAQTGHVVRILIAGPHGIGKTRLLAEVGRMAFERGATVRYARGDGPVPQGTATGVALLVYDDLQEASLDSLETLIAGVEAARPPALLLFAAVESELSQAQRFLVRGLADVRLQLRPLATDEVATLVRLYVPDAQLPQALAQVESAGGVPLAVHDRASRLAEEWAARKVGDAAATLPTSRQDLRAVSGDIVDGVVDLQRARAQRAAHAPDRSAVVVCPYKGLATFDQADAAFFFGRERLTAELVARLVGSPMLAVVGPSGSGKSSAVRAGLLPALAGGVLPSSNEWNLVLTAPHLDLPDLSSETRTVLVIDQFEELFTALSELERRAYVERLLSIVNGHVDFVSVVVTLRADYFGRCAEHPDLARLVSANTVLVPPMTSEELRAAVEDPARAAGLEVEPGVVEAVVADAGREPGALPLVSTALLALWERRHGRRLTLAGYHESGGVRGGVAQLAETTYTALTPEQKLVARRTLLRLGTWAMVGSSCVPGCPSAKSLHRTITTPERCSTRWRIGDCSRSPATRSRSPTRHCCANGRDYAAGWRKTKPAGRCARTSAPPPGSGRNAAATRPSSTAGRG